MAAIADFETLRAEVTNWLSRSGDLDFEQRFSLFVQLVEGEVNDRLRVADMETEGSFTVLANDGQVQMPADFGGVRGTPYIVGRGGQIGLDLYPLTELVREGLYGQASGARAYAMHGRNMVVRPISSVDQTVTVRYYKRLAPLADGANFLITSAPDVYFNGCLARGFEYLGREDDGDETDAIFQALIDDVIDGDAFERWGASPLAARAQHQPDDRPLERAAR